MSRSLQRWGRFAARRPWVVIGAWVTMSLLVLVGSSAFGEDLEDTFSAPGVDSQKATELLSRGGSDQGGVTAQIVVTPIDEQATFRSSASARDALASLQQAAELLPNVVGTSDVAGALATPSAPGSAATVSADGAVALIRVQYPVLEDLSTEDLENLKELAAATEGASPLRIELGGELLYAFEEPETGTGEALGLVVAMVILLLGFGSVVAMGLPIGMAVFGIALGVGSMSLITRLVEIPSWAPVIASMVGLGVGIDYALFIVTRHREYLATGLTVEESVGRAVATAGRAVVVAGVTVVIAILGLAVSGVPFLTAGGIAVSVVVLIMVLASVTLLPAFLGLAGKWINRLGLPRRRTPDAARAARRWERWGRHVSAHAAVYVVGSTVLLLALAAPLLALRVGTPDDGSLPQHRTERQAYDLVSNGFGPGANGPLVVAVDTSRDASVVDPIAAALRADEGVARVDVPTPDAAAGVATLLVIPTTGPQDDTTIETLDRLRADVLPSALGDSPARAHIGGQTAAFADVGGRVADRLPYFIGAVVLLSFLLLVVVFRSILVPLKAALLNLLSIGAAFGVVVMVFQWGWGADLIGLESTIPVMPFIPLFMFAILFGLSMDYEVFLLSRIREEYLASHDNEASVIHGIATTARVITSAALIMVSVFMGFVLGSDPTAKMLGLGLAVAVLVDATLVRLVLLPATMKLLGPANWWLPAWLDRLLPVVDVLGEAAPAPRQDQPRDSARESAAHP